MNVIETYFELSEEERTRFRRMFAGKEYRKVEEMELTYFDKLELKGRAAGVLEGKRETLLRQLNARFGPLTDEIQARVAAVESASELDLYLDRVVTASSLEDMGFLP